MKYLRKNIENVLTRKKTFRNVLVGKLTQLFSDRLFFSLYHTASSYNKICRFKGITNMSILYTYIRDIGLYMQRISLEKYKAIDEEEDHSLAMQRET